ncbi:MAG: class I SAM-dependent methyltransferase [Chloroflexota bacterium]|nr:class I SAM-dependent methyltransferase [Chloroflexota bacterium]
MPGSTTSGALREALQRYRQTRFDARWLVHGRAFLSDLPFVEQYVPRHGFIVDLGCGQGLFSNLLKEVSPQRRVLGTDIDARKIEIARRTIQGREGLRFEVGDITTAPPPRCDAVVIVDVLYLLPLEEQETVLRNAASALAENTPVIVKAQERSAGPKYALTYAQEMLSVNLGFTRGGRRLHFASRDEALDLFRRSGLLAHVVEMRRRPYTDVVYLARKAPPVA